MIYTDPTGHCVAGKDKGCYADSFSGVDQYINVIWSENLEMLKNGWKNSQQSKLECSSQKCINKYTKLQKRLESLADEIRNNPCNYEIAGGCIDGAASFAIQNGKAIGVVIKPIEYPTLTEILLGKKANANGLPDSEIGSSSYGKIVHYYHGNDHAPPHVHVYDKDGKVTRVGQNGKPLAGDPELNRLQSKLVQQFKPQIRSSISQIMKWYRMSNKR